MKKLLYIEDDEDMREIYASLLSHLGYDVTAVGNLESARQAYAGQQFDLVLTDYELGIGTGIDLVKEIRGKGDRIPIVVFSGTAQDLMRDKYPELDQLQLRFVGKDAGPEVLINVLKIALKQPVSVTQLQQSANVVQGQDGARGSAL